MINAETKTSPFGLFLLRAVYFFALGGLGAMFPFMPLILRDRGLLPSQIAWVMVMIPISNVLMPPIWGTLADALHARIWLLRIASFACAATVFLLLPARSLVQNMLALAIFATFRAPLSSLADAATCAVLGGRRENTYSLVRVWGSLGFAIFSLLIGWVSGPRQPLLLFGVTAACYLGASFSSLGLKAVPIHRERGVLRQTLQIVLRRRVILFLLGTICYSFAHGFYDAYYSLHARSLGLDDWFVGTAWAVGVVAEIVMMIAVPKLLGQRSTAFFLALCALVSAGRWLLISLSTSAGLLLSWQLLHAFSYGLWYPSLVKHVQAQAPERLRASLQSVAMASIGLGTMPGYIFGGRFFQAHGGAALFHLSASVALTASLLYWFVRPPRTSG